MGKKPRKKPKEIYAKYLRSLTRIGKVQAIHNIFYSKYLVAFVMLFKSVLWYYLSLKRKTISVFQNMHIS